MTRYNALQVQRQTLVDESKALFAACEAAGRGPTEAETARVGAIKTSIESLDAELTLWEEQQARERASAGRATVVKDLAAEKPWESLGHWFQAVRRASLNQAVDPRLNLGAVGSGMHEGVGVDGGFAVPPQFAPGIEKLMWESGELLSRVDARGIDGNAITYNVLNETSRADGARRGAVAGYWVDEGVAPTASSVKLAKMELKLRKVAALGYMTDELQEDAAALADELQTAFVEELTFKTEDAIYRGVGTTQPLGFLNAPCLVTVSKESGQAADTIVTTNLSKMWARMPARSKRNAVWLINVDCEPQLDELTLPAGTGALQPRFVDYGPEGTLRIKGRPVLAVEYAAGIGDLGDIALVDLSQYRLIRKASGIQTASSMHVRFTQGENTFRAIYRVDGQPVPRAAITPFKGTATLSPFIVLEAR